jgi:CheY-like chemotaxis protein
MKQRADCFLLLSHTWPARFDNLQRMPDEATGHSCAARLIIADDNDAMRYMFKMLTPAECEIIGEAETGETALQATADLRPDILLLDISMPGMGGFEVARILRDRAPEVKIILISLSLAR